MKNSAVFSALIYAVLILSCSQQQGSSDTAGTSSGDSTVYTDTVDLDREIVKLPSEKGYPADAPLEIEFLHPQVPESFVGTPLGYTPLSISPEVTGTARWATPSLLVFQPQQRLQANKTYTVTLHGKKIFSPAMYVPPFEFSFTTAKQGLSSMKGELQARGDSSESLVFKGTIILEEPMEAAKLQKDLTALIRDSSSTNPVEIRISAENTKKRARRFSLETTTPLYRKNRGRTLILQLPSGYWNRDTLFERAFAVPKKSRFRVTSLQQQTSDKLSTITVAMSDPFQKNYDVSGFVNISPQAEIKSVRTEGNALIIQAVLDYNTDYTLTLRAGLPSRYNTKLGENYAKTLRLENIKPKLKMLSRGVYNPSVNQSKIQFRSVNIKKATAEIYRIYPQNMHFFLQENTITASSQDYRYDRVAEKVHSETLHLDTAHNRWQTTELDLKSRVNRTDGAYIVVLSFDRHNLVGTPTSDSDNNSPDALYYPYSGWRSTPSQSGYYYEHGTVTTVLFNTDIALIGKKSRGNFIVTAVDYVQGTPLKGITLKGYDYYNNIVNKQTTDSEGTAVFEDYKDRNILYVIARTEQGWTSIKTSKPSIPINKYNTSGDITSKGGIELYTYADRGVHRPGDSVYISGILRINGSVPPEGMPVTAVLKNARNQTVFTRSLTSGTKGHFSLPFGTETNAPTGNWSLSLTVGNTTFTKKIPLETVKPERLKIEFDDIRVKNDTLKGSLSSSFLFGKKATALKTKGTLSLSEAPFAPRDFEDFTFKNPTRSYAWREQTLFDTILDGQGKLNFTAGIPSAKTAPTLLQGRISARVFEKGGNSSRQSTAVTIAPYEALAGIKNPFRNNYVSLNDKKEIPFIIVDTAGSPLPNRRVKISVYHSDKYWWWSSHRRSNSLSSFKKSEKTTLLSTEEQMSGTAPGDFMFTPTIRGQYLIEVRDMHSGHSTGMMVYASAWGHDRMAVDSSAPDLIDMNMDKPRYTVGDTAQITIQSPAGARAFITLEQQDSILHSSWANEKNGRITHSVALPRQAVPNAYISVELIQPYGNDNDIPLRMFTIAGILVDDPKNKARIAAEIPDEIEPNDTFSVTLRSADTRDGTYTITVVDEGLLSLTDFKSPDPLNHFFSRKGLSVKTLDTYSAIRDALLPNMQHRIAVGGDNIGSRRAEMNRNKRLSQNKAKRFKPVVLYQGPKIIQAGGTVRDTFTMPNYSGAVRIMIAGAAKHSYQKIEKSVPVRTDLTMLPTVPRLIRPMDTIDIPVSLFNMDSSVMKVSTRMSSVSSKVLDNAKISGTKIPPGRDTTITFRIAAPRAIGTDTLRFTARGGKKTVSQEIILPVKSATPFTTAVTDTIVSPKQAFTHTLKKQGYDGTNAARLKLSRVPDINLNKRLNNLIRYPYGCIEQTTSATFPQIYLEDLLPISENKRTILTKNINGGIDRLRTFQTSGGFSYWPGQTSTSTWGTLYASHFIVEARKKGYYVPDKLYNHGLRSVRRISRQASGNRALAYKTYGVFILALAGEKETGTMNYLKEQHLAKMDRLSAEFLSTAYHLSGFPAVARRLDSTVSTEIEDYRELSRTYGSTLRDAAMVTYLSSLRKDRKQAYTHLKDVISHYKGGRQWFSTQEQAVSVIAMARFYDIFSDMTSGGDPVVRIRKNGSEEKIRLKKTQALIDLSDDWGKEIEISLDEGSPIFVSILNESVPFSDDIATENSNITMQRRFYTEDGVKIAHRDILRAEQNVPFWMIFDLTAESSRSLEEIALTAPVPAGWEIVNRRISGGAYPDWLGTVSEGEYMDIRDGRINWFFDLPSRDGKKRFAVKIMPTYTGQFKMPAVSAEAMYSPEYYARKAGSRCRVTP
ncbi:MAG: alpha-2-macroglobulin family protein [Fibrobacterota bacterium]